MLHSYAVTTRKEGQWKDGNFLSTREFPSANEIERIYYLARYLYATFTLIIFLSPLRSYIPIISPIRLNQLPINMRIRTHYTIKHRYRIDLLSTYILRDPSSERTRLLLFYAR